MRRRVIVAIATLPLLAGGVLLGLSELFVSGMTCDESCDPAGGGGWRSNPHAWEWSLIGVCGVAGCVGVVIASGLAIAGRRRAALAGYCAAATAYLVPLAMALAR